MHEDGYKYVTNIDFSTKAIEVMQRRAQDKGLKGKT